MNPYHIYTAALTQQALMTSGKIWCYNNVMLYGKIK